MCVCVCTCVPVCARACVCVRACVYALRIASTDKILCFINNLIINYLYDRIMYDRLLWETRDRDVTAEGRLIK